MADVLPDPFLELLLVTLPMIKRSLAGEKLAHARRAWTGASRGVAARAIGTDVSGLPKDRRMAAIAVVDAALDLAHRVGLTRIELAYHFNLLGERGQIVPPPEDETVERLMGFVLAFAAQALVDRAGEEREARHA